jgi:cytochrome c oxidase subunit 2
MPAAVRRTTTIFVALACALACAGTALAANGGLTPQSSDSPNARAIEHSYVFIGGFTLFIFVLVEGLLVFFLFRFRRGRRSRTVEGPQIHGSTRLELIWTVFPVLILAAIAGFIFYKLPEITDVPEASAGNATEITVEGHQFYWLFEYPNGAVSVNTLWAPADEDVRLKVVSPEEDVIHSWWVPKLGGKIDAIPGRTNHTWFRAREGTYHGQCAEYCGTQHAVMYADVRVVPRDEYRQRTSTLRTQLANASPSLGRDIFEGSCMKCHRLEGPQLVGPTLGGNPVLADREALELLVRNGRGNMPPVAAGWSDQTFRALFAYTRTLTQAGGGGTAGGQG